MVDRLECISCCPERIGVGWIGNGPSDSDRATALNATHDGLRERSQDCSGSMERAFARFSHGRIGRRTWFRVDDLLRRSALG
jgi:hypothetical protein